MTDRQPGDEPVLAKLDDAVLVSKNANRYLWLRDHCTHEELMALVALVRSQKQKQDRASVIDAAVDAEIAADLAAKS